MLLKNADLESTLPHSQKISRTSKRQSRLTLVNAVVNSSGMVSVTLPPILQNSERLVPIYLEHEPQDIEQVRKLSRLKLGIQIFSENIAFLRDYNARFTNFKELEGIIRSILEYGSEITIKPLGEKGIVLQRKASYINLEVILKFAGFALENCDLDAERWFGMAITIYYLHEISHDSQGFAKHENVKAIKSINQHLGRHAFVELDLRSDYLAARTLSILETFRGSGPYNDKAYRDHLYLIWCKVCRGMLETFSRKGHSRKDKVRRVFGYLLMSHCIQKSYRGAPFSLTGELVPNWNTTWTEFSVKTNDFFLIPGVQVERRIMRKIHKLISDGKYDLAQENIVELWRTIPK